MRRRRNSIFSACRPPIIHKRDGCGLGKNKIDRTKKRLVLGRKGRNRLLAVSILTVLLLAGSAFSESLNIRIRNLIRLPSLGSLSDPPGESGPSAPSSLKEAEIRILAIRLLSARAMLTTPPSSPPPVRKAATQPGFGKLEEAFAPVRFDTWDRKHKPGKEKAGTPETWVFVTGAGLPIRHQPLPQPHGRRSGRGRGHQRRRRGGHGLGRSRVPDRSGRRAWSRGSTLMWGPGGTLRNPGPIPPPSGWGPLSRTVGPGAGCSCPTPTPTGGMSPGLRPGPRFIPCGPCSTGWPSGITGSKPRRSMKTGPTLTEPTTPHRLGLQVGHRYDFPKPGSYIRLDKRLSNDFAGDEGYLLAEFTLSGRPAPVEGTEARRRIDLRPFLVRGPSRKPSSGRTEPDDSPGETISSGPTPGSSTNSPRSGRWGWTMF